MGYNDCMKVALVCDDLIQMGGHEKVVMDFCEIFPEAPLYTTVASKKWSKICREKNINLRTSFLQYFPFMKKMNRYYAPFGVYIFALNSFDFSNYDIVISLSSRFVHGIKTELNTKHICYMSTVGRMFWEPYNYFDGETYGLLSLIKFLAQPFLAPFLSAIRVWDYIAGQRPHYFLCNSKTTQSRIKKYYRRDSKIIHPSINVEKFIQKKEHLEDDYFLILTRLVSWKKVDLAIEACKKMNKKLKIVGTGPATKELKKLANGNIEFMGYVSEEKKISLLQNCVALINTQYEDFGIAPLESMASGRPVVAFGAGGALETVVCGKTGEFFKEHAVESLVKVLKDFNPTKYSVEACQTQANKFNIKHFKQTIKDLIYNIYLDNK